MTYALLIAFIVFNAADAGTTLYGLRNGMKELNPIMSKLFSAVGVKTGMAITKVPISLGAIYAVVVEQAGLLFVLALAIPYSLLLAWNVYQIKRNSL